MLCKMGLSCHPTTVASKLKEMGKDHDKQLLAWKKKVEFTDEVNRGSEILKAALAELTYLPNVPSTSDIKVCAARLRSNLPLTTPNTCASSSLMTLDAACLNLACSTDTDSVMENICSKVMANNISKEGLIASLEQMSSESQNSVSTTNGYQIIGDNCDLHVNVRHMTNENKNKSFHWFNCVAFQDQVTGNHLPDVHEVTLEDVPVRSFFPSNEDTQELKRDFMILWSRCIVKHLPSFGFLKRSVIYHIPHPYSDVMKQPVPEVSLILCLIKRWLQ